MRPLVLAVALVAFGATTLAPLAGGVWAIWHLGFVVTHSAGWADSSAELATRIGVALPTVPIPPGVADWGWWLAGAAAATSVAVALAHTFVPLGRRIRLSHSVAHRVRKGDSQLRPLLDDVADLAARLSIRPPSIWITSEPGIQGGAWAAPGRGAISLSLGALQLPADERRWLIAHELAHIEAGDSLVKGLWVVICEGVNLLRRLRAFVLRTALRAANVVPILGHLVALVLQILGWIMRVMDSVVRGGFTVVQIIDRWFERNAERNADATARDLCGGEPGVRLLQRLGGSSPFAAINPFRAHPTIEQRIHAQHHV